MDVGSPLERRKGKGHHALALFITLSFLLPNAWASPKILFDIPAGNLPEAVVAFGKQAGVEVLYVSVQSNTDVTAQAVKGAFEPAEALQRLLEGTGFEFEFESERSVLLRQAAQPSGAPAKAVPAIEEVPETAGSTKVEPEMSEVTVTGSYLRGVLDIMSPLVSVEREEMSRTPYATVQDALLTLPFNSLSSQDENFGGIGNFNRGIAPNLRNLGYGATLVLVNGRRQVASGTEADFVDVSNIPWSMVDHIEVLPDGASALYGSDAVAGVVNIIMRDDVRGAETKFRTGTAADGAAETLAAQLFGDRWDTGHWLFSYQYSGRTALAAADREYAADADKRPLGGRNFRTFRSNPGNVLDLNTFAPSFAIPPNQDGRSLDPTNLLPGQVNLQNQFATYDIIPKKKMHSVFVTASQKMAERVVLFVESRYTDRNTRYRSIPWDEVLFVPSSNAFFIYPPDQVPFALVAYNFLDDFGPKIDTGQTRSHFSTLEVKTSLSQDWRATLSTSYGEERLRFEGPNLINQAALAAALADPDPATAFNPFGDGTYTNPATVEAIRFTQREHAASTIASTSLVADGKLFDLPAGAVKLAIGAEYRREALDRGLVIRQRFAREMESAFAEISLPLVGSATDPRAIPRLELSLAGRYESYSDFGQTFNPKVGLRWVPRKWLKLRTSWSTSFKAPNLVALYDTLNDGASLLAIPDPRSATGQSIVLGLQGSNPDLTEETATTWTAGLDFSPGAGFAVSLTYFDVNYDDQIIKPGPPSPFDILLQEEQWAPVIRRNPARSEVVAVCQRPDFFGSVEQCLASSPAAIIDISLRNLASVRTRGLDVQLDHSLKTDYGFFRFDLSGTYTLNFDRLLTKTSPSADILDTVGHPLALRLRSSLQWNQREQSQPGFFASATANYAGSYRDTASPLRETVEAWMPIDLQFGYRWSGNLEFRLNAVNVFDKNPPFVDREFGYDLFNARPYGRVISLYAQKAW